MKVNRVGTCTPSLTKHIAIYSYTSAHLFHTQDTHPFVPPAHTLVALSCTQAHIHLFIHTDLCFSCPAAVSKKTATPLHVQQLPLQKAFHWTLWIFFPQASILSTGRDRWGSCGATWGCPPASNWSTDHRMKLSLLGRISAIKMNIVFIPVNPD